MKWLRAMKIFLCSLSRFLVLVQMLEIRGSSGLSVICFCNPQKAVDLALMACPVEGDGTANKDLQQQLVINVVFGVVDKKGCLPGSDGEKPLILKTTKHESHTEGH